MNPFLRWYWTARGVGWDNLSRRAWFLAQRKLGMERRALPPGEAPLEVRRRQFVDGYRAEDAPQHWRQRARRFFIDPDRAATMRAILNSTIDASLWKKQVTHQVERLAEGEIQYFGHRYHRLGWPARFHYDPIHDVEWPSGVPASAIDQLDPRRQDIKCVWEASRFSVAYALAREHVAQPDSPAAELFWLHFDAWDEQNPYGLSVNWSCSQEASFRLMAWLFAACAMLDSPATSAPQLHRLTELAWYTGRQVSFNIDYARSQKNNHALSEAAALWTLGHMFPELRAADKWREQGCQVMLAEMQRQVYDDGSYVQHSLNYHRVMLDDCLWAMRIGQLHDEPLEQIAEPVARATDWLLEMIDPSTGRVPNYGPNDGAQVLPLSCCDYLDFRPVAQAAHFLLHGKRAFSPGPWDEKMLWLFGPAAAGAPVNAKRRTPHFAATTGGYYTLAGPRSWCLIRAHQYVDRPHQADMLHFDLWSDGENILRDGGSYHYNGAPPWKHYFESTAAHNTIEIDGQDQMIRGPRFLWLRWTEAKVLRYEQLPGDEVRFVAEHHGYRRLKPPVTNRRSIHRQGDQYEVRDELSGNGEHHIALRWRLCPGEWRQTGNTFRLAQYSGDVVIEIGALPAGTTLELVTGQIDPRPDGWESLYYADRQPVPVIVVRGQASLPVTLETCITIN
ncbi:MAG: alginate lyase family protein [Planctomycetia bacterium]|nr:alginate lyase family protein [Planctomycetia bacterium]